MQEIEKTITDIKEDQKVFIPQLETLKVSTKEEMEAAAELLGKVKARIKRIEEKRVEYTKPLNDQVKKFNADFKAMAEPYVNMETELKRRIGNYVDHERKMAALEQARLEEKRRQEAAKIAEQEGISNRAALAQIEKPVVEVQNTSANTDSAKVSTKVVWKFEVVNVDNVPEIYKVVDEKLIRKAVASGVHRIAGVRIWDEAQVAVSTKDYDWAADPVSEV